MASHFEFGEATVSALITLLVTTLFIHFAAKFVLDRSSFLAAFLTALLGTLAAVYGAGLIGNLFDLPNWAVFTIAIAIWALIAALFFRTAWIKGAIIGLVAWVLYVVVQLIMDALF